MKADTVYQLIGGCCALAWAGHIIVNGEREPEPVVKIQQAAEFTDTKPEKKPPSALSIRMGAITVCRELIREKLPSASFKMTADYKIEKPDNQLIVKSKFNDDRNQYHCDVTLTSDDPFEQSSWKLNYLEIL